MKVLHKILTTSVLGASLMLFSGCFENSSTDEENEVTQNEQNEQTEGLTNSEPSVTQESEVPSDILERSSVDIRVISKKEIDRNADGSVENSQVMSYDPLGNLTQLKEVLTTSVGEETETKVYVNSYNTENQLTSQTVTTSFSNESIAYTYDGLCETAVKTNSQNAQVFSTKHCYNTKQELLSTTEYFNGSEVVRNEYEYDDSSSTLLVQKSYDAGVLSKTTTYEKGMSSIENNYSVYYLKEKVVTQTQQYTLDLKKIIFSDTHEQILRDTDLNGEYDEATDIEYKVVHRVLSNGYSASDILKPEESALKPQ